ncbi:MAG: histidine phosphatase family protein [Sorangiineae bacterium]|nr:histidine phosphatase family protein [Polyangiaceae bacterium]MEB2324959.1 histidine phosphatase family protein [Sorangiineae bacterium]
MHLILVRHGESEGNRQGRMQGHLDFPLSPRGEEQARHLAAWLEVQNVEWSAAYSSPLRRASETAAIIAAVTGRAPATPLEELREIGAGSLEGMSREDMTAKNPAFLDRGLAGLGDFAEFGGESYDDVQARVARLRTRLEGAHRAAGDTVLLVGHGGINFQLLKSLICEPVPRVCIVRMGNCTATRVRMRERRGVFIGEVVWHVPIELMGGGSGEGAGSLFR